MKKFMSWLTVIALTGFVSAQSPQKLPVDPQVRYGKLENGLTYFIRKNAYPEQRADFYIAQKVGSMQEENDQAGLAHFLEHMAFNGTKNYPGKKTMLNYLETIGVKFGANVNAYTSFDETVYNMSDVPVIRPSIIDSCLLVLHDWSSFISLKEEQIDEERAVIKEEWRTRNDAQSRIWDKQLPTIFEGSKYADRMPIGKMDIVENFSYQTLRDYYHKWYRPDLQAIVIVGDINVEEIEAKVKAMFADIPKPVNPAKREYYPVPDNDEPIISVVTDPEAVNARITIYMKHDILPEELKGTEAELMYGLLKRLASIALSDRLKEISQKANAPFVASYAGDSQFFVSVTKDAWTSIAISKQDMITETLSSLIRENQRIKQFGVTDAEIERAKANILQQYENAYNNRNKELNDKYVQEYVNSFINNEGFPGIEYEFEYVKKMFQSMNASVVSTFVQGIINDTNVVISITGPEIENLKYPTNEEVLNTFKTVSAEKVEPYVETVSNEPLISQLPKAGKVVKEITDEKLGATIWTLSNGMKVVIKNTDFKDDQILMSAVAYGGKSIIGDADIYNVNLASTVLNIGGIGNFSATDLKKVLAGKTAGVSPYISDWNQGFSGSSNIKNAETLLQLTYLHFTAPRKDEDAYKNLKEAIKSQLINLSNDPDFVMGLKKTEAIYPGNIRMKEMTPEDVDRLNYDRIIEIYKEIFANPGSYTFTFVGTIDQATFKPLVEQYLASLPSGNKDAKYKKQNVDIRKGKYTTSFEQEMKTPKSSVFGLYSNTLKRDLKTRVSLSTLKQILDIVFIRTVREGAGGTYGVSSQVQISRIPDGETKLQIMFDTDPERVTTISPIIDRDIKNIAKNGPEDADFQKVKEYMLKKYKEDEKTNGYWLGALSSKYFYNEDIHSDYLSTINALTKDDVKEITKQILAQDNFIEVIMNPKK